MHLPPLFQLLQGFGTPEAQALVVMYRALHDSPPRLPPQPQHITVNDSSEGAAFHEATDCTNGGAPRGTGRSSLKPGQDRGTVPEPGALSHTACAAISRYLLLCSPLGKGRGQFLRWLVDAGSRCKVSELFVVREELGNTLCDGSHHDIYHDWRKPACARPCTCAGFYCWLGISCWPEVKGYQGPGCCSGGRR